MNSKNAEVYVITEPCGVVENNFKIDIPSKSESEYISVIVYLKNYNIIGPTIALIPFIVPINNNKIKS